jgi:hypothetical protein
VLAAEEFPVGDADPVLHADHALGEPPHDVLAAEEFPVGDADPGLHAEQAPGGTPHRAPVVAASGELGAPERARHRIVQTLAFATAVIVGLAGLRRRRS